MSASGARASLVPFMLHAGLAACWQQSAQGVQESEEMEGEGRGCRENSFEKREGERANAGIDKRTAFMLCGQGTVPAGLPEALVQLQKSILHSLTPVPCWWHLGVSVLCIYMHSRVVETAAASTLDMGSPFVLLSSRSASEQSLNKQPLCLHMSL